MKGFFAETRSGPIFVDIAVLMSENTSDKKSIVHTLSLKEGSL